MELELVVPLHEFEKGVILVKKHSALLPAIYFGVEIIGICIIKTLYTDIREREDGILGGDNG